MGKKKKKKKKKKRKKKKDIMGDIIQVLRGKSSKIF